MIAVAAYFRAEHRHFEPENELRDWLDAGVEIDGTYFSGLPSAATKPNRDAVH